MFFCFFFYLVFFHEHSRFTRQQGKGKAISLSPLYHFHPLHRHLDYCRKTTSDYCRKLTSYFTLVYIPKYHCSVITTPHNILFTCKRNSRSSATLTVGIEFPLFWVCFTFCRTNIRSFWSTFLSGAVSF